MALGPMEIHHKEFNTVRMGGYNKEEVDTFLDQVADEMDRLLHRTQELVGMVEGMRAKVTEYDGMQQTLQNALINAQRSADSIVQEAKTQADGMLEQAGAEAALRMEEANRTKEAAIQEANTEKDKIGANLVQLRDAANEYISNIRGMLESTSQTVTEYELLLGNAEANIARVARVAVQEASPVETTAPIGEVAFATAPAEEPIYETPVAEAPLYEPPASPMPEYPAAPVAEAPLYEPPASPMPEYPAAPVAEAPLYEPPVEEPLLPPTFTEPVFAEPLPVADQEASAFQETLIESAGMMEPHAYVPDIKPMDEMPIEDSPIPPLEPGQTEPQAFVPSIHLDDSEPPAVQPYSPDSLVPPPDEASRLTLEDLAGAGNSPLSPAPQPVTPAEVEREYAPQPEKEEKVEKHFFWE